MRTHDEGVMPRLPSGLADARGWDVGAVYEPDIMRQALVAAAGLSPRAVQILKSSSFDRAARRRIRNGHSPFKLRYAITRAASLDWIILDLFYQLCGFRHFRKMFDLAERGEDEGPICNLSLVSQYLSRYREFAEAPRKKNAAGFMPYFDGENDGDAAEERRTAAIEVTESPDTIVSDHA